LRPPVDIHSKGMGLSVASMMRLEDGPHFSGFQENHPGVGCLKNDAEHPTSAGHRAVSKGMLAEVGRLLDPNKVYFSSIEQNEDRAG
jgi:hypothetical protein